MKQLKVTVVFISKILILVPLFTLSAEDPGITDGMILVHGGSYRIGIEEEMLAELMEMGTEVPHMGPVQARWWFADEMPGHTVHIESFYMDIYEVSNSRFRLFVESTDYDAEGNWEKYAKPGRENHPVINVSWNDAAAYAEWSGKRLPTETEWECAAAGGLEGVHFPWGNEVNPEMANYRYWGESFFAGTGRLLGLRKIGTESVGSYPANGYGLYDMAGNAAEWTADVYRPYPDSPDLIDPYRKAGPWGDDPPDYSKKAVRGGSWETPNAVFLRITKRSGFSADDWSRSRGFRCVKTVYEDSGIE